MSRKRKDKPLLVAKKEACDPDYLQSQLDYSRIELKRVHEAEAHQRQLADRINRLIRNIKRKAHQHGIELK